MLTNIEHKFNSPNEELEWLRNKYKEESSKIDKSEKGDDVTVERNLAVNVLRKHTQKEPDKVLSDSYKLSSVEQESAVSMLLNIPPESHDKRIGDLLALAEERGVLNAVSVVRKLEDPHLEDDFHRAVIQFYIRGDISKQKIKKPLSQAMNMVLYEVSLPHEKEEEKKEKSFKEFISAMEQFYNGMMILNQGKEEYLALEIGLPTIGEEIVFYAAVPRSKSALLEKQISALFANARVEEKREDYNIFKPGGVNAGSTAKLKTYPVLPIRTYDKFEVDPMLVLSNSFSKLRKIGEGAALQIILGPAESSYGKKIKKTAEEIRKGKKLFEALKSAKITGTGILSVISDFIFPGSSAKKDGEEKGKEKERKMETVNEEMAKMIEEKSSRPLVSVNLRILVSSDNQEKSDRILKEIESSFLQFTEPQGNALNFKNLKGGDLDNLFYKFSFRLFDKKEAFYFNTAEIATVFHFPKGISSVSQIKYVKAKDAPPPLNLSQEGILLGKNFYRGEETMIHMKDDDRRRHFYVIGQTGTGKSVLLKNMIIQDIERGKGVCYIDPHGSDLEDILSRIPKERVEDLIYFDPAGRDRTMGLNMLEYNPDYPEQKTFIVNELLGIFNKLFDMKIAGGPMFEQYFRNATLLVMDDPASGNTLLEISRVMSNKAFREMKLSKCKNLAVNLFWRDVAEKAGGEASLQNVVPYITSKFDNFLGNDIMRPIIAQEKSSFDFRKIMDEKKILLINLSKGRLGDINSHLLGLIIVGKILMSALSRADIPEDQRNDFYLYIDEFQNVTTDSIATILSEARKYKLNLIIAHQFIGQLEENIKKAVFGNVGSVGSFRVGAEDGEFLAKQFEPVFDASDLLNIDNYRAYLKMLIGGQSTRPFSITTLPFKKGDIDFGKKVAELSIARYGRSRVQVDEEINKKFNV